jgi:K+-transporting ATPase c subunit
MERDRDGSISAFNAILQAARIARARGVSIPTLRALIAEHTTLPPPGDRRGYARVDVQALNAALDALDDPRVPNLCRRRRFSGGPFDYEM